jgi:hypothetical protein
VTARDPTAQAERRARLDAARASAANLAQRLGFTTPSRLPIEDVAELLGAQIVIGPLPSALAQVVRIGSRARIRVSDAISSEGRRRFSIAHELGHLWLGHLPRSFAELCSALAIEGRPARVEEAEASVFAAEFLMPTATVDALTATAAPNVTVAREIADAFGVSLTAAARRLIEVSPYACALTVCRRGRIAWATRSASFTAFLPRDRVPGAETAVVEHLAWGTVPRGVRQIKASEWLGDAADPDTIIMEDALALSDRDDVLTILVLEPHRETAAGNK